MAFLFSKPADTPGSAVPAVIIGMFVAFGGVLFGYDTGTIGGILAMQYWRNLFSTGYVSPKDGLKDVTAAQTSEIVSILSAGTFFGALLSAPIADFLGRRLAMIFNTGVFTFGVILQTAATAIPMFVAGRFLFLAAIVLNSTKDRQDTGSYRIPIAIQFAWAIILVVGMLLLPETPRFLIKKGNQTKAARSLSRLRRLPVDHPAVVEELAEIQANHEYEMAIGTASYLGCFKPPIRKRLFTGMALQALQQLTGVNFIFYYGIAGIHNPFIVSVITDVVNVCSTVPGLWLVERWGRRPLLLFGAIGMSVCQLIVASVGTARPGEPAAGNALIAFVCIYIFFFACSWGPCAWVVTGEIFPLKARAKGLSMTTASNWLLNWAIAYATPYMVNPGPGNANLGSKVFFVWGGFCCICMAFVYFCIYETKGLSLEQVDELYAKVSSARKSPGFVPSVQFTEIGAEFKEEGGSHGRRSTLADLELAAARRRSSAGVVREDYIKS
ncbi:hypothetical protein H2202_002824 [Exophiala xenobiotica]|nr:hypothetical protein H2202_002824 [Exophiala xenobiotica]